MSFPSRAMRVLAPAAALLSMVMAPAAAQSRAQGRPLYAWVQAAAGGAWQVRMILPPARRCPAPTRVRAEPDTAFAVRVCEWTFPAGVRRRVMAGDTFAAPDSVSRVTVIGDTGCRAQQQDCADPLQWPFGRVADDAARAGGQLVIHVGDYIYRERCTGQFQPCGDNWPTWEADFLAPGRRLLESAPWVLARGNHEDCTRGGRGWYRFFDPGPFPASGCAQVTNPVAVRVRGVGRVLILDTSCAPWYSGACWAAPGGGIDSTQAIPFYADQLRKMAPLAAGPSWLVTHVPVWAKDLDVYGTTANPDSTGSFVLQAAVRRAYGSAALPPQIGLSLVGHIHIWELIGFAMARTPVLLAGNGGTARNDPIPAPTAIDGVTLSSYTEERAFGYTVLERVDGGWRATLHAIDASCTIGASAACVTLKDEDEAEEAAEEAARARGSRR
ncbi:MAG TPA: metallophosphoesterase [Longimicrobium sp.]